MASHHHHRHHQSHPHPTSCVCSCCCSSSNCCTQTYQPSPPPQDPLFQALASQLLQQHPLQPHLYSPYLTKPHTPHNIHKFQHQKHHSQQQDQQQHTQSIISSLLRRIDDFESSLHHFSTHSYNHHSSYSLRDLAARIIQTHFRAFLVRRSRTLRQLKDLALIKSTFNSLKSSISNDTHLDSEALSHKAMDLLLKLDSIQGGDPMIRDGKRSISRELVRFLEFIDGVSMKRHGLSTRAMKNVRLASNKSRVLGTDCGGLGGDRREILEKLRGKLEKIRGFSRVSENDEESVELEGFQHLSDVDEENPRIFINEKNEVFQIRNGVLVKRHGGIQSSVKKSVSFAENGNVTRVFTNPNGYISSPDGSVASDDQGVIVENLCSEVEGMKGFSKETDSDEEAHLEIGGSQETSDGERNPRRNLGSEGGHFQNHNGKFVFSAPLPVKMESRADLMKKKKAVKIVT